MQITRLRRRMARIATPARIENLSRDQFEGYASLFGVTDGAGDTVAPGAFAKSLRLTGIAPVRMLYQHFAHEPIGVWEDIREDARGLYVRGRLVTETGRGRDVRALIAEGALDGLSIGFKTRAARRDPLTRSRVLTELELWEISIVTFPLLAGSQVTAIGAKSALANVIRSATAQLGANMKFHAETRSRCSSPVYGGGGAR